MAITQVGTTQTDEATNGGNVSTTPDGSPAENDYFLAIVLHSEEGTTGVADVSNAGYTELFDGNQTQFGMTVQFKKQGATPDTTINGNGNGNARHATGMVSETLRGCDLTTFEDAAENHLGQTLSPGSNHDIDPGAITTATDGAWVYAICIWQQGNKNPPGSAPSGYTLIAEFNVDEARDLKASIFRKEVASAGSEDPGSINTNLTNTGLYYDWVVFAVRPATGGGDVTTTAETGSYTLSGTAADSLHNRHTDAAAGSYALGGTAADSLYNRHTDADAGSYVIGGQDANSEHHRVTAAAAGAYTISGQDAESEIAIVTAAEAGSYVILGTAAGLRYDRRTEALAGAYVIDGQDATSQVTIVTVAGVGSYIITGTSADSLWNRLTAAGIGAYVISGSEAGSTVDEVIIEEADLFPGLVWVVEGGRWVQRRQGRPPRQWPKV